MDLVDPNHFAGWRRTGDNSLEFYLIVLLVVPDEPPLDLFLIETPVVVDLQTL
jgi:hypothetical protein